MKEFWSSFTDWLKEKTSSPLYFTYIFFLIIWNWKFFYTLFGENSILFTKPRIEYVSEFLEIHVQWISSLDTIFDWVINTAWHILPPAGLTYLAIIYLPRIYDWAYSIHIKNHFNRKIKWDAENSLYEKQKTINLKGLAVEKQEQKIQKELIYRVQTQEEKWLGELEKIIPESGYIEAMKYAKQAVYGTNGHFASNSQNMINGYNTYIPADYLSRLDSIGLIKILNKEKQIEFTEKGKFFLKELQNKT